MLFKISLIMIIFDYIFFRVASIFYKKDGVDAFRAIVIVTVIQCLILGEIGFGILRLIYNLDETSKYSMESKYFGSALFLLILFFNYLRYKTKYWHFSQRWKQSESEQERKARGFMIVLLILLVVFFLFWMGTSVYR